MRNASDTLADGALHEVSGPLHHSAFPETRLSVRLDAIVRGIGDAVAWLWVVLLVVIVSNVVLRYVFGEGRIELEELQWHLYAVGFLAGIARCVESDEHIRVDFLQQRMSARMRAWIELYGILLLLFPFVAMLVVYSVPFVAYSFARSEISVSPGGLPLRWLIKSTLTLGIGLVGMAAFSRLLRVGSFLFGFPAALENRKSE